MTNGWNYFINDYIVIKIDIIFSKEIKMSAK